MSKEFDTEKATQKLSFDAEKATQELSLEIDKIDFAGGVVPPPTPASAPVEPAVKSEPTPESEVVPESESQDAESDSVTPEKPAATDEPTPEPGQQEPAADGTPAVPDSHYRALQHMQLEDDFAELYDKSPQAALKMAAKAYEMVNASSRQLADLGRQARQLREQPPQQPVPAQPSRKEAVMKKLKEKYEDDPIIDLIGELIPDQTPVPEVQSFKPSRTPERNVDQEVAVLQQINTFFAADEMDVYSDFYGKTSQARKPTEPRF
jgi:hypothetical protein